MKTIKTIILCSLIFIGILGATSSQVMAQEVNHFSPGSVTQAVFSQSEQSGLLYQPDMLEDEFVLLIEQLESDHGPFDYRLSEPLQAAGSAMEKKGDFIQALRFYDRALHVTRINSGLYSENQIEIVEALINANVSLENWIAVDNHFRYLHLLYTRLYKEGTPELNRGLAQISDWHVLAINNDFGTDRISHLRDVSKLFQQRLKVLEGVLSEDDPVIRTLRYNINISQYHLRVLSGGGSDDRILSRLEEQYEDRLAALD
ncbi:MAG: hypothetical protein Q8L60_17075 [Gammaproteobacteria bacterium]|nr:hypothetical protein [Gammaproteobacteria bacterium]MDP2140809.1 hypothetical protein [Gammaproteobacteria bacterium]MDP2347555.1 hypothetical protein [Gammaproteobacteria bacterium]